jgi:tetratricopeptide (TPR) repeat protein
MRKAAEAFRGGDVATALLQLQAAIELYPDASEPHRVMGLVYAANDQFEQATAALKRAVAIGPADERSRLALADVLERAEQLPQAEQVLHETIAAIPASGRAHYQLARVLQHQGKQPEAIAELERSTTFAPLLGLNGIYQTLGAMNAALQRFDQAIQAYGRRVELQPNDAGAHQDLGDTYARLGRDDEALAEFSVALLLEPRRTAAFAAIAQVRLRNGAYEDAAAAARRAVDLDPAHAQAHYTLGTALLRLGNADEGQRELETFQRLQTELAAARARDLELGGLRREASVSSAAGDHQKAVALLRRALEIAPNEMVSHLNLGIALMLAGQPVEAIERFNRALALNGPDEIHQRLAQAYAAVGRNDDSRRELELYEQLKQTRLQHAGAGR